MGIPRDRCIICAGKHIMNRKTNRPANGQTDNRTDLYVSKESMKSMPCHSYLPIKCMLYSFLTMDEKKWWKLTATFLTGFLFLTTFFPVFFPVSSIISS